VRLDKQNENKIKSHSSESNLAVQISQPNCSNSFKMPG